VDFTLSCLASSDISLYSVYFRGAVMTFVAAGFNAAYVKTEVSK